MWPKFNLVKTRPTQVIQKFKGTQTIWLRVVVGSDFCFYLRYGSSYIDKIQEEYRVLNLLLMPLNGLPSSSWLFCHVDHKSSWIWYCTLSVLSMCESEFKCSMPHYLLRFTLWYKNCGHDTYNLEDSCSKQAILQNVFKKCRFLYFNRHLWLFPPMIAFR